MKILLLSDLHGYLPIEVPDCDGIIIAGDICPRGMEHEDFCLNWVNLTFNPYLESLGLPVLLIGGNHDWPLYNYPSLISWAKKATYLQNSGATFLGMKAWGIPHCPELKRWAFYANDLALKNYTDGIPTDTELLVVHSPPYGFRDNVNGVGPVGNKFLTERLIRGDFSNLKYVVAGHIHESRGFDYVWSINDGAKLINASCLDECYRPYNKAFLLDTNSFFMDEIPLSLSECRKIS